MGMTNLEFQALLEDESKRIVGDISWEEDEDHSPTVEFRVSVDSEANYPVFVRASNNALAKTLTYALIHRSEGRIYALDLGKDHHNPTCQYTGEKHRHRYTEQYHDKQAYVPTDITADVTNPVEVWNQFCVEAKITHVGMLHAPPPIQRSLFL